MEACLSPESQQTQAHGFCDTLSKFNNDNRIIQRKGLSTDTQEHVETLRSILLCLFILSEAFVAEAVQLEMWFGTLRKTNGYSFLT